MVCYICVKIIISRQSMQKWYEFLFVVSGEMTETQAKTIAAEVEKVLGTLKATNIETHILGKRRLAYKIERVVRYGTYVLIRAQAGTDAMATFKEKVRFVKGIIRSSLTVGAAVATLPTYIDKTEEMAMPVEVKEKSEQVVSQSTKKAAAITQDELDKKIDALLTEDTSVTPK